MTRLRLSAGILLYRSVEGGVEVLLGHPGGPYYAGKDEGHWSVLKGEVDPGEDPLEVARREFEEESGHPVPDGHAIPLGEIVQKGGKTVVAWAVEGDVDPATCSSNTFDVEWPPRSGKLSTFPEIDRVDWFGLTGARTKIKPTQIPLLDRLERSI